MCRLAWIGDPRVVPRTQASLAVSADDAHWVLINATPDLRAQIAATPELQPRREPRDSPIAAVMLTGAEVDQAGGLLCLRERQPFTLHATAETLQAIADNPIFGVLGRDLVKRRPIARGEDIVLPGSLEAEIFTVPGKLPLYLEGESPDTAAETGANVGVELRANGARLAFVPSAAAVPPALAERLARADVILFDGTFYTDDEMIRTGTGNKAGRRMGHMPIDGEGGSLVAFAGLKARRIYCHINNTNPILVAGSAERDKVEAAGWEVAEDGMEIVL